ncbi:MAG TPA: biopolymer transporter ExbD [Phycisphaerae bacterium]|nr:biopolymer transporter ExbD [Phycisphaerae bacterium]HPM22795.1 biopolymer transporter ExbD [Phycisphaerae bacterium]
MFRPPTPARMTLNLAPMVDVMMCLIIFFLLASRMVAAEHYPVDLPWALAARNVESAELGPRATITVRRANGGDDEAEYVVADWDGERIVERVLLADDIRRLLTDRAARAERGNQKLRCVIRADRQVMYKHVEVVLRACGLAKVSDVVFTANAGRDPEEPE